MENKIKKTDFKVWISIEQHDVYDDGSEDHHDTDLPESIGPIFDYKFQADDFVSKLKSLLQS